MRSKMLIISTISAMTLLQVSCSKPVFHYAGIDSLASLPAALLTFSVQLQSISDDLYYNNPATQQKDASAADIKSRSCDLRDTATITIFTKNGNAQSAIDVKLDGVAIGSLRSYYPDNNPACSTSNSRGIITLKVPEGTHTLEAESPNVNWPRRTFSVNKCTCMLLPLS